MKKSRFTDSQIIAVLKQTQDGTPDGYSLDSHGELRLLPAREDNAPVATGDAKRAP